MGYIIKIRNDGDEKQIEEKYNIYLKYLKSITIDDEKVLKGYIFYAYFFKAIGQDRIDEQSPFVELEKTSFKGFPAHGLLRKLRIGDDSKTHNRGLFAEIKLDFYKMWELVKNANPEIGDLVDDIFECIDIYLKSDYNLQIKTIDNNKSLDTAAELEYYKQIIASMDDDIYNKASTDDILTDDELSNWPQKINIKKKTKTGFITRYARSPKLKARALDIAKNKCEFDKSHKTFARKSGNKDYVEVHHIIPMSEQENKLFEQPSGQYLNLDVLSNLICLCPICHARIHYGSVKDVRKMIEIIYDKRISDLEESGLNIKLEDLKSMY